MIVWNIYTNGGGHSITLRGVSEYVMIAELGWLVVVA
jgi:hypothetical protein